MMTSQQSLPDRRYRLPRFARPGPRCGRRTESEMGVSGRIAVRV
jgi:hypothetical protein